MPLSIRKVINVAVVLYKPSRKEMLDLMDELLEYPDDISEKIFNLSFQKTYDQLWIDVPSQTIYHNADKIIVHLDKDDEAVSESESDGEGRRKPSGQGKKKKG